MEIGYCIYNQVKMKSLGWALIQYDWCPQENRGVGIQACIQTHRDHVTPEAKMSDAAVSQGMLRVSRYHGKLAKLKEAFYPEFQREHGLTDTLNLDFQFLKL